MLLVPGLGVRTRRKVLLLTFDPKGLGITWIWTESTINFSATAHQSILEFLYPGPAWVLLPAFITLASSLAARPGHQDAPPRPALYASGTTFPRGLSGPEGLADPLSAHTAR